MNELNEVLLATSNFVWSYVIVGLCVGVGLFFTVRLLFIQVRSFPHAIALLRGKYDDSDDSEGITTFQALSTALSSTTGIGNIAGVAVAINLGGPGAIFWMWMMAILGMALKFAEGTLGSLYREPIGSTGMLGGGPMAYITKGLGERWRPVATFYAACTAVACLGAWNMFQSNQAAATLQDQLNVPTWVTGVVMCVFVALVLVGGIKRIGVVAARLVPTMCVIYVSTVLVICAMHASKLPDVMDLIISEAFNFGAAGGGAIGTVILIGIRRAIFSNEAGTGSAAIAHAAATTRYPVRQGIVASLGPFIDTIVVCAATAFVILLSGFYGTESYQNNSGSVISFENANVSPAHTGNWTIESNIQGDDAPLQQFTSGSQTLALVAQQNLRTSNPVISLAALATSESAVGIRFSARSNGDTIAVRVLNGGRVAAFSVIGKPFEIAGQAAETDAWPVKGSYKAQQWSSYVLMPPESANAVFSNTEALQLEFQLSQGAELEVDRIEFVDAANGIVLSTAAFSKFFGLFGGVFIPIAALFFAYTTVLAGNYYGEVACHYLNSKLVKPYLWIYIASTFIGCVVTLDLVINFSDLTLGMMAIPNVIVLAMLSPVVVRETKRYFAALKNGELD
ncbi:MAG: alanine/glycine:cation symporter family protein [Pseudomonadales bacterium]